MSHRVIKWINISLIAIFFILFIRYQQRLLPLMEWGDESETIMVSKLMAQGYRLYIDVYNNHGPLTFLPGYLVSLFGNFGVIEYRYPIMALQVLSLLSIYVSPVFKSSGFLKSFTVIILGTFMISFLPQIYGHMYLYQVMSGLLIIIITNLWLLPSLLNKELKVWHIFVGALLTSSLPFLAITVLPLSLLTLVIAFRQKHIKAILAGLVVGLLFNLAFIYFFASFKGYYAYHFYLNYAILNDSKPIIEFIRVIFVYYTENFMNFFSMVLILIITSSLLFKVERKDQWKALLILPLLVSLVIRGGKVYDLSGLIYLYALIGFSSALFAYDKEVDSWIEYLVLSSPSILAVAISIIVLYLPLPSDRTMYPIPTETEFSAIVKKITNKEDRILALTFRSFEYIVSDRLPVSGQFFYLPIQGIYNQNPYQNIKIDLAQDILKNPPKIILADKWTYLDKPEYAWEIYAKDIDEILDSYYYQLHNRPIYIRKDIDLSTFGLNPITGEAIQ